MKAEHRKELQTNELADSVGKLIQAVRTGPSRSTLWLLGGVVLAILTFVGIRHLVRSNQQQASAAWVRADEANRKLSQASDLGQVDKILEELAATPEGQQTLADRTVQFTRARTLLRLGLERMYAELERDKARAHIEQAEKLYAELAAQTGSQPILHQEALMGRAKALESLGRVDDALPVYEQLAKRYPNSARGKAAEERAKYLQDHLEQVQQFYGALASLSAEQTRTPEKPNP